PRPSCQLVASIPTATALFTTRRSHNAAVGAPPAPGERTVLSSPDPTVDRYLVGVPSSPAPTPAHQAVRIPHLLRVIRGPARPVEDPFRPPLFRGRRRERS